MSLLIPTGMDATTGQFNICQAGDILKSPGIVGLAGTPSVTPQTASGSGASATIVGTNISGKIVLTTGSSLLITGKLLTLTLANSFAFPGGSVAMISSWDANFAGAIARIYAQGSTTGFDLYVGTLALGGSTAYTFYYLITGW